MTIFLSILKILGIILAVILALILWIILIPRNFRVEYSKADGFTANVNVFFFRVTVYPLPKFLRKKKTTDGKKSDGKKGADGKKKDEKKKSPLVGIEFSFDLVKQVIGAAGGIMKRVFKAIKFRDVSFTVPLHSADARETAQLYGRVTAAFTNLNVFLQHYVQIYYKCPLFVADYAGNFGESIYFYSKITASPLLLLAAGIYAFGQYRRIMKDNAKKAEKE